MLKYFLLALLLLTSACVSQDPVSYIQPAADKQQCLFVRYDLELVRPGQGSLGPKAFSEANETALSPSNGRLLFLSGGSQHGAFGAGFLQGWKDRNGRLPKFSVVTGISTGALLSTGAFIGQPEISVKGFGIDSESQLLETYVDGKDMKKRLPTKMLLALVREGSISDLIPLRSRLGELLTRDVLSEVAVGNNEGRRLYVGATDYDTGQAVAFDMTDMAARYADAKSEIERQFHKTCYIEALVASAIVPVAAKPVFIDNRMYVDGGVRFAVFAEDIGKKLEDAALKNAQKSGDERDDILKVYIILNGDGKSSILCGKKDKQNCKAENSGEITPGEHEKWDFFSLAARSVKLLTNQVTVLSIDRAKNLRRASPADVYYAEINESKKDDFSIDSSKFPEALKKTSPKKSAKCAEWRSIDAERDSPVEFHPRYMQCLIAYGNSRGSLFDWSDKPEREDIDGDLRLRLNTFESAEVGLDSKSTEE